MLSLHILLHDQDRNHQPLLVSTTNLQLHFLYLLTILFTIVLVPSFSKDNIVLVACIKQTFTMHHQTRSFKLVPYAALLLAAATKATELTYAGCVSLDPDTAADSNALDPVSPELCAAYCNQSSYEYSAVSGETCKCWATEPFIKQRYDDEDGADCYFNCSPPYDDERCGGLDQETFEFLYSYWTGTVGERSSGSGAAAGVAAESSSSATSDSGDVIITTATSSSTEPSDSVSADATSSAYASEVTDIVDSLTADLGGATATATPTPTPTAEPSTTSDLDDILGGIPSTSTSDLGIFETTASSSVSESATSDATDSATVDSMVFETAPSSSSSTPTIATPTALSTATPTLTTSTLLSAVYSKSWNTTATAAVARSIGSQVTGSGGQSPTQYVVFTGKAAGGLREGVGNGVSAFGAAVLFVGIFLI
ncbi:hypothetical protein B0T17DRAFT_266998 [Bombardia bombarda]|uniref:WSC domain-containing protein n=1 Tax=Bombardia bombarda TaxID=252184 RepID=A0AA39X0X6_9PEZI|nr:hypothetical protein B0T17DRAFT_266998 [Bombardia bombarda]